MVSVHSLTLSMMMLLTWSFQAAASPTRLVVQVDCYMHDGRLDTLEEVIDHYESGVRQSEMFDPNLAKHPLNGLSLANADKRALVAFIKTLTDNLFAGLEDQ